MYPESENLTLADPVLMSWLLFETSHEFLKSRFNTRAKSLKSSHRLILQEQATKWIWNHEVSGQQSFGVDVLI